MKLIGLLAMLGAMVYAQPPAGAVRRGPMGPEPLVVDATEGFESIFEGTMKGWDGDPDFWRVEGGSLVGETTKEKPMKANTFLIWRGGEPADFELKLDFKMNSTNSGVQYRSAPLPEVGKWVLRGYQADFDFENRFTGQLYEERGRGFLAMRGQVGTMEEGKKARVIANLKSSDDLRGAVNINGWNTLHVIARGNVLIHILNGQLAAAFVDDDAKNRAMKGLIGMQLHVGPPMRVEYKNIYLKKL
ncbi:MAG: DUF1080 domain-containing protein [Bryobacteraceae bacterium]